MFQFLLLSSFFAAMDDAYHCMIGVADVVSSPLYKSIYGSDFHRGPCAADGTSFSVGEDISSPVQLSVIGQVKAMCVDDNGPILMLGRPEMCGETMHMYWRQEISALERIELRDDFVDLRVGAVRILFFGYANKSDECLVSSY
jgi:hypothetical protein